MRPDVLDFLIQRAMNTKVVRLPDRVSRNEFDLLLLPLKAPQKACDIPPVGFQWHNISFQQTASNVDLGEFVPFHF